MEAEPAAPPCPQCGAVGPEVPRRTVVAVTRTPLPRQQTLRLCRTPACELIYYAEPGAWIEATALSLRPVFKGGDVVCFCFLHRADADGQLCAGVVEAITDRVRARDCSCDLRNPSGKCCLGELRRTT